MSSSLVDQPCYTIINSSTETEFPSEQQLKKEMENPNPEIKEKAIKRAILMMLNGEKLPTILMAVIQHIMTCKDRRLKKPLLMYWELVPKTTPDGKMLRELILVCDAYRKDLQHPNEFIRGSTLRFLCKLKAPELLEPVMPAIRACLEHSHSYVRRNAVLAIFTIYKNSDYLIPDAPELISNYLTAEQDMSCKRNAFMMLVHADQSRAVEYLVENLGQLQSFGDILQLVIVELIYKVCRGNPSEKPKFIKCILSLINAQSAAVRYEAAGTLVTLSSAPTAIKAAASCYIDIILKQSDNNVKLVVLDRLMALAKNPVHETVLAQQVVMDVMRVLAAPDLEVRKKCLDFIMQLITPRNVDEVVGYLKKEISKTQNEDEFEKMVEYRQYLVRVLHRLGVKYPSVASTIIPLLMEFMADGVVSAANDVIVFVREAVERLPELRPLIMARLMENVKTLKNSSVIASSLWILGEFADSVGSIKDAHQAILDALGELPLVDSELRYIASLQSGEEAELASGPTPVLSGPIKLSNAANSTPSSPAPAKRLVNADGTYISQSALTSQGPGTGSSGALGTKGSSSSSRSASERANLPSLRAILLSGDFQAVPVLCSTLTKLALKYRSMTESAVAGNEFLAQCMLVMASILHFSSSGLCSAEMDEDVYERAMLCIRVLSEPGDATLAAVFEQDCHRAFVEMLQAQLKAESDLKGKAKALDVQADDLIQFRQLRPKGAADGGQEDEFEASLSRATGTDSATGATLNPDGSLQSGPNSYNPGEFSRLNRVHQLTGFSDPIYAEAYVTVNQYDIVLDLLVVNQTGDTLQNLTLELSTMSDLKLGERPTTHMLGPHDFCNIRASVKVASTETGTIFGNVVYDVSGSTATDRNCVILNEIHIDIMDYITPASCSAEEFREMWAVFDWENRLPINTNMTSLLDYFRYFEKNTNMRCLTPDSALTADSGILVANFYAKTLFGEDALANLSIELFEGRVTGHARVRSKTQGLAISLGNKITFNQLSISAPPKPPVQTTEQSQDDGETSEQS